MGITLMLLAMGEYCYSQPPPSDSDTKQSSADDSWISRGEYLGKWWRINPMKYQPLPNPLLYHLEGGYSYSEASGNLNTEVHTGNATLTLRKNLFTSTSKYRISNRNTNVSLLRQSTNTKEQFFGQRFHFALMDNLSIIAGAMWEKSSTKYLEDRWIYYGGLKWNLFDTPKYKVNLIGSYGKTETTFMSKRIREKVYFNFPSVEDYNSSIAFFHQDLSWKINDNVTFSESVGYGLFLEDSEYYFVKTNFKLDFKIAKNFSIFTSYDIDYDYNLFVKSVQDYLDARSAAGLRSGEMETTDTKISVGIKFNF